MVGGVGYGCRVWGFWWKFKHARPNCGYTRGAVSGDGNGLAGDPHGSSGRRYGNNRHHRRDFPHGGCDRR